MSDKLILDPHAQVCIEAFMEFNAQVKFHMDHLRNHPEEIMIMPDPTRDGWDDWAISPEERHASGT